MKDNTDICIFEYWTKCEEVAMHFNRLLIDFRLKAAVGLLLGVVAAGALTTKLNSFVEIDFGKQLDNQPKQKNEFSKTKSETTSESYEVLRQAFVQEKEKPRVNFHLLLFYLTAVPIVLWLSVAALDLYYQLLLLGAVRELCNIEKDEPKIRLTSTIVDSTKFWWVLPLVFYGLPYTGLMLIQLNLSMKQWNVAEWIVWCFMWFVAIMIFALAFCNSKNCKGGNPIVS